MRTNPVRPRAATVLLVVLAVFASSFGQASATTSQTSQQLITLADPELAELTQGGMAVLHSWTTETWPDRESIFSRDFAFRPHRNQPTWSPLQRRFDTVVAAREHSGTEVHLGIRTTATRAEIELRVQHALSLVPETTRAVVEQKPDGGILLTTIDRFGHKAQEVVEQRFGIHSNCGDDPSCVLVSLGVGAIGLGACTLLGLIPFVGLGKAFVCGLISLVGSTGVGYACSQVQPGCTVDPSAAHLPGHPLCRDWYCQFSFLLISDESQPFLRTYTFLSWRNATGHDIYIQGAWRDRHVPLSPQPVPGVYMTNQTFEVGAPRDIVICTTMVSTFTHAHFQGQSVSTGLVDVPKFNTYC